MQFVKDTAVAPRARRQSVRSKSASLGVAVSASLLRSPGAPPPPRRPRVPSPPGGPLTAPPRSPLSRAGCARRRPAYLREGVAAVVNNDIISTYDLRQRILLLIVSSGVQPTAESLPQLEREALRDLVDERLQMQEIQQHRGPRAKVTLEPTDQEIDEDIAALARQNNLTGQQLLASLASGRRRGPSTLRDQIRAEARLAALRRRPLRQLQRHGRRRPDQLRPCSGSRPPPPSRST